MKTACPTKQSKQQPPWAACPNVESLLDWLRENADVELLAKVRPVCTASGRPRNADEKEGLIVDVEASLPDALGRRRIKSIGLVRFYYETSTNRPRDVSLSLTLTPCANDTSRWCVSSEAGMQGLPPVVGPEQVATWVDSADWVVAHHAAFDRPLIEAVFPVFRHKCWACSCHGIDWQAQGASSRKLEYLAMLAHHWHESHRAEHDCHAVLKILACEVRGESRSLLDMLLSNAQQDDIVVRLKSTPAIANATERGYHRDGNWLRAIFKPTDYLAEVPALKQNLSVGFNRRPHTLHRVTATDRFSERPGEVLPAP